MNLQVEIEKKEDNRWIAEIPALPSVLAYGQTRQQTIELAKALALRVLADRLEHGEVYRKWQMSFQWRHELYSIRYCPNPL